MFWMTEGVGEYCSQFMCTVCTRHPCLWQW